MTREELKAHCERQIQQFERVEKIMPVTLNDWKRYEEHKLILELLEQELILDKIRAEIKEKIEQEEFARSVFRHEEKDAVKAEQCTGSIMAYNNVIKLIDKYKADKEYEAKVITRGNCMMCGKELTEGLFFCKECEAKAIQGRK